jgi:hypothetical protein
MKKQPSLEKKQSKAALTCSACGCKMWLWDVMQHRWQGEYHFADCPAVPGGAELAVRNAEAEAAYLEEPTVPREQGARILAAIHSLMQMPKGPGGKPTTAFAQRKAAILGEIGRLP